MSDLVEYPQGDEFPGELIPDDEGDLRVLMARQ